MQAARQVARYLLQTALRVLQTALRGMDPLTILTRNLIQKQQLMVMVQQMLGRMMQALHFPLPAQSPRGQRKQVAFQEAGLAMAVQPQHLVQQL